MGSIRATYRILKLTEPEESATDQSLPIFFSLLRRPDIDSRNSYYTRDTIISNTEFNNSLRSLFESLGNRFSYLNRYSRKFARTRSSGVRKSSNFPRLSQRNALAATTVNLAKRVSLLSSLLSPRIHAWWRYEQKGWQFFLPFKP